MNEISEPFVRAYFVEFSLTDADRQSLMEIINNESIIHEIETAIEETIWWRHDDQARPRPAEVRRKLKELEQAAAVLNELLLGMDSVTRQWLILTAQAMRLDSSCISQLRKDTEVLANLAHDSHERLQNKTHKKNAARGLARALRTIFETHQLPVTSYRDGDYILVLDIALKCAGISLPTHQMR